VSFHSENEYLIIETVVIFFPKCLLIQSFFYKMTQVFICWSFVRNGTTVFSSWSERPWYVCLDSPSEWTLARIHHDRTQRASHLYGLLDDQRSCATSWKSSHSRLRCKPEFWRSVEFSDFYTYKRWTCWCLDVNPRSWVNSDQTSLRWWYRPLHLVGTTSLIEH